MSAANVLFQFFNIIFNIFNIRLSPLFFNVTINELVISIMALDLAVICFIKLLLGTVTAVYKTDLSYKYDSHK